VLTAHLRTVQIEVLHMNMQRDLSINLGIYRSGTEAARYAACGDSCRMAATMGERSSVSSPYEGDAGEMGSERCRCVWSAT